MLTNNDVFRLCSEMLHSAGMTAADLLAHSAQSDKFPGVDIDAVHAAKPTYFRPPTRVDQAFQQADRPGGVSVAELSIALGITRLTAYTYLNRLEREGRVTGVSEHSSAKIRRFFANWACAANWADKAEAERIAAKPKPVERKKAGKPGAKLVAKQIGTLSPKPVKVAPAKVEAVMPAGLVIKRFPAPPGRYEVRPDDVMSGGFVADWRVRRGESA